MFPHTFKTKFAALAQSVLVATFLYKFKHTNYFIRKTVRELCKYKLKFYGRGIKTAMFYLTKFLGDHHPCSPRCLHL